MLFAILLSPSRRAAVRPTDTGTDGRTRATLGPTKIKISPAAVESSDELLSLLHYVWRGIIPVDNSILM